ncbi:M48 family metallopeptidase [Candidatus Absconditicoccus praedator]|uniref:M48 family metallopeptidase n=1 Tax=Candidatus Absconditicoccus praedator TaxID=2735562 RepID=UPI001E637278|nr:M48 family metallopeptidase [Candidatus Absconditicoccus praedator]
MVSDPILHAFTNLLIWLPVLLFLGSVSFYYHKDFIFSITGVNEVTRKEEPFIYNTVENLCISRGLKTPNIGIIEDNKLNAFAIGWNDKNSWIVFTRGLIENLTKKEIQAVAAHELTHIKNKDNLLILIIILFIGVIKTLGEAIIRSLRYNSSGNKGGIYFFIIGTVLLIVGHIIFPFVQLAITKSREFLADAGAVELTKDKDSMISALKKIQKEKNSLSLEEKSIYHMYIENPSSKNGWTNSHPSIEDRIKALESY